MNAYADTPGKELRIELRTKRLVVGKFIDYQPSHLRFLTSEGVVSVLFAEIPEELQQCFPSDAETIGWRFLRTASAQQETQNELMEQALAAARAAVDAFARLGSDLEQVEAELCDLRAQNAELRNQLAARDHERERGEGIS